MEAGGFGGGMDEKPEKMQIFLKAGVWIPMKRVAG
jgi:hypothetical protein